MVLIAHMDPRTTLYTILTGHVWPSGNPRSHIMKPALTNVYTHIMNDSNWSDLPSQIVAARGFLALLTSIGPEIAVGHMHFGMTKKLAVLDGSSDDPQFNPVTNEDLIDDPLLGADCR
jgi:hypothetical protein